MYSNQKENTSKIYDDAQQDPLPATELESVEIKCRNSNDRYQNLITQLSIIVEKLEQSEPTGIEEMSKKSRSLNNGLLYNIHVQLDFFDSCNNALAYNINKLARLV